MSLYSMSGIAGMSYNSAPVQPVNKIQGVNGALQTKTVEAAAPKAPEEVEVLSNGDFKVNSFASASTDFAQPMYVDPLTNQRVWSP